MDPLAVLDREIGVLVADSNHMQSQLLHAALRRRPEFRVRTCGLEIEEILKAAAEPVDVAIMNVDDPHHAGPDLTIVRRLHVTHPEVAKVLVLSVPTRDVVVNAFRSGARGLFCFSDSQFRQLCKCIHSVHRGQIWASSLQLQYLVEMVTQVPSLRVVNSSGSRLLTPREEQVVALVADGMINRDIARELDLSEHTVKKYLFRIFDKLGVSSRLELALYAVHHGGNLQAEWVAGAAGHA